MTRRGGSGGGAPLPMNPTSSGSQGLRCGERGEPPASWPSAVTLSQYQRASRLAPQRGKSTWLGLGLGLGLGIGLGLGLAVPLAAHRLWRVVVRRAWLGLGLGQGLGLVRALRLGLRLGVR